MNDPTLNPTPQFGTAEYAGPPGSQCQLCHQGIGATYYRLNDAMVCPSCVEKIQRERGMDTHAAFVRAITAGIGAAVAGMIGYALLTIILQGWVISYHGDRRRMAGRHRDDEGFGRSGRPTLPDRRCASDLRGQCRWQRFPSGFILPGNTSPIRQNNKNSPPSSAS